MTDVFTSVHHTGDAPAALVYGRALVGPLAFCALPLMIGAAVAALQQARVLPFLVWGLPITLVVATLWTRFRLGATPAEVWIRPRQIAVRSVRDGLHATPVHWQRIHQVRPRAWGIVVTAGFDTYRFAYAEWPDHAALLDALHAARTASTEKARP